MDTRVSRQRIFIAGLAAFLQPRTTRDDSRRQRGASLHRFHDQRARLSNQAYGLKGQLPRVRRDMAYQRTEAISTNSIIGILSALYATRRYLRPSTVKLFAYQSYDREKRPCGARLKSKKWVAEQ